LSYIIEAFCPEKVRERDTQIERALFVSLFYQPVYGFLSSLNELHKNHHGAINNKAKTKQTAEANQRGVGFLSVVFLFSHSLPSSFNNVFGGGGERKIKPVEKVL